MLWMKYGVFATSNNWPLFLCARPTEPTLNHAQLCIESDPGFTGHDAKWNFLLLALLPILYNALLYAQHLQWRYLEHHHHPPYKRIYFHLLFPIIDPNHIPTPQRICSCWINPLVVCCLGHTELLSFLITLSSLPSLPTHTPLHQFHPSPLPNETIQHLPMGLQSSPPPIPPLLLPHFRTATTLGGWCLWPLNPEPPKPNVKYETWDYM